MDDMEQRLGTVLNNPELMQKIMTMAQSLGQTQSPPPEKKTDSDFDPVILKKIIGAAQSSGIDQNQKALLGALTPYLSRNRLAKLESAMRAAKLAKVASSMLGGAHSRSGR